jgi:hypothetical protein
MSQQMRVVLTHHLDHDVEPVGRQHDVVDRVDLREPFGDRDAVARAADSDHRLAPEAELCRVGDGDECITPALISLCTRCRTAPSEMPTDSAMAE